MPDAPLTPVDVLVLGGGAAGLSAALSLGRSRRTVRVLDAGEPRNATSPHAHNLLTHDGTPPSALLAAGRDEVARYGVEVVTARAVAAQAVDVPSDAGRDGAGSDGAGWAGAGSSGATHEPTFAVRTADGRTHHARRLVVATGMRDVLPDVPGLRERWGRDVLHCPYCHGWEVRDRRLAVLATGPRAVHAALLVRQLSADVTLLTHDAFAPDAEQRADLAARGVRVVPGRVTAVRVEEDALTGIVPADGDVVPCDAVFVGTRAVLDDAVVDGLGLQTTALDFLGEDVGRAVAVDATGATSVPGVWAAGNVTGPQHALAASIAAGSLAGAHVNASLVTADVAAARAARVTTRP
ncbi:NAD(P)/FAD-dependent oxidoreductase [Cellulomonas sp. FA1]|uniref:NAD(P)/FAD-dependent oxidoreductase n=1 Tax=Cellulomonas sp. FA1 TaxID=1346710 RepID=UPI0006253B68|nr:NAD(P)/FAD-dependent oxidoreductase [Cellulomonas sp. FA1]